MVENLKWVVAFTHCAFIEFMGEIKVVRFT